MIVVHSSTQAPACYLTTFGATCGESIFPVFGADGHRVVGTIDVESDRVNAFAPEDIALLETFAELLRPLWRKG